MCANFKKKELGLEIKKNRSNFSIPQEEHENKDDLFNLLEYKIKENKKCAQS